MASRTPQDLPDLLARTETDEDRVLAIVGALVIENRLDRILAAFIPGYKRLSDKDGFTFSMKIELLRALALIPPSIVAGTDAIREVRNRFAHNLDINFESLPRASHDRLKNALHRAHRDLTMDQMTVRDVFKILVEYCTIGLDVFIPNVMRLRKKIEAPAFIDRLYDEHHREFVKSLEKLAPPND